MTALSPSPPCPELHPPGDAGDAASRPCLPARRDLARQPQAGKAAPWLIAGLVALGAAGAWWGYASFEKSRSAAGPAGAIANGAGNRPFGQGGPRGPGGPGGPGNPFAGPGRVQPVSVGLVRRQDIRQSLQAIGTIAAANTAVVKAKIEGELKALHFKEGQWVQAGALLAELDNRSQQITLSQAEGQLARDQAQLQNARVDLVRFKDLLAKDGIAKQQVDTQEALVRQLQGTVQSDQAQVDNARLQLSYTRIVAPISGRIGLKQADLGNVIRPGDANGLLSIAQTQPVNVVFAVPDQYLPRIAEQLKGNQGGKAIAGPLQGGRSPSGGGDRLQAPGGTAIAGPPQDGQSPSGGRDRLRAPGGTAIAGPPQDGQSPSGGGDRLRAPGGTLTVEAWDREQKHRLAVGQVASTDNAIDVATSTIKLKASFANADGSLFPNQFVNVRLHLSTVEGSLAVPAAALLRNAEGNYVYLVTEDKTVTVRPVVAGATDGEWVGVQGDLQPGDHVVVDGVDRLRDGAKVEVVRPQNFPAGEAEGRGGRRFRREGGGAPGPQPGASAVAGAGGQDASPRGATPGSPPGSDRGPEARDRSATASSRTPAADAGPEDRRPGGGPGSRPEGGRPDGAPGGRGAEFLSRLPPDVAERVRAMSPEERRAWFQQERARRAAAAGN